MAMNDESEMKKTCVIHSNNCSCYIIKEMNSLNEFHMQAVKVERERLSGDNHHKEQCDMVPANIIETHGIHMQPCYKKR